MLTRLWLDEGGAVISAELILVMVILVIGVSVGLVAVRDAVDAQLVDVALAISAIDTSFSYDGLTFTGIEGTAESTASVSDSKYNASVNISGMDTVADVLESVPASEEKEGYAG